MTAALTTTQPFPPPLDLPSGYRRHDPSRVEQHDALAALVQGTDWAALSWTELIERLLQLGRTDVPLSRLAEGHIDAVRILDQAEAKPHPDALYGVWASRSQRTGLAAIRGDAAIEISGTLRFASGAGLLERALVPVWPAEDQHLLLDVDVSAWPVDTSRWRSSAMALSRTHEIPLPPTSVPASAQIGEADFYLSRPGFFPGGVGVAACWLGGAARVADTVHAVTGAGHPGQRQRLGTIRTELVAGAATVRATAALLDQCLDRMRSDPAGAPADLHQVATEARAVVAGCVRRVLAEAKAITGPTGLALDDDVAHVVPDLEMYVGQQNADADAGLLGDPERRP